MVSYCPASYELSNSYSSEYYFMFIYSGPASENGSWSWNTTGLRRLEREIVGEKIPNENRCIWIWENWNSCNWAVAHCFRSQCKNHGNNTARETQGYFQDLTNLPKADTQSEDVSTMYYLYAEVITELWIHFCTINVQLYFVFLHILK